MYLPENTNNVFLQDRTTTSSYKTEQQQPLCPTGVAFTTPAYSDVGAYGIGTTLTFPLIVCQIKTFCTFHGPL